MRHETQIEVTSNVPNVDFSLVPHQKPRFLRLGHFVVAVPMEHQMSSNMFVFSIHSCYALDWKRDSTGLSAIWDRDCVKGRIERPDAVTPGTATFRATPLVSIDWGGTAVVLARG